MATRPGGGGMIGAHPLMESPIVDAFPDGHAIVVAERGAATGASASFRLMVVGTNGDTLLDSQQPYEPIGAAGWMEDYERRAEERPIAGGYVQDPRQRAAIRSALAPRETYPPVSALLAGSDGTIWLRREDTGADELRWEVRDSEGGVLGEFWAPRDLRLHVADRNEVWATRPDEVDVPFLIRFRVVR